MILSLDSEVRVQFPNFSYVGCSVAKTAIVCRKGPPQGPTPLEVEDGQVVKLEAGTYKIVVKGGSSPSGQGPFGTRGGRALPVDPRDIATLAGKLKDQASHDPTLGGLVSSGQKVQVAVAPFLLIPDDLSTTVSSTVTEFLSTELIKSGGFKLVERAQLEKVLEELGFQQSGVVDPETAKKIGKITGASTVMVGSLIDQGTYAVITCRLINTETGESTIADSVELRK
jgi:TolB-like protein